ncbi:hypothetical protein [Meiothermus sp.]|uniref:hypothetical protein n=1 Tax=Meiothermus sp. TaxID=1955249 RepID=UPI00345BB2EA
MTKEERLLKLEGIVEAVVRLLPERITSLEGRLEAFRQELTGEIQALRGESKEEIAALRQEMKGEIAVLQQEMQGEIVACARRLRLRSTPS